jgi:hypothetical protein
LPKKPLETLIAASSIQKAVPIHGVVACVAATETPRRQPDVDRWGQAFIIHFCESGASVLWLALKNET